MPPEDKGAAAAVDKRHVMLFTTNWKAFREIAQPAHHLRWLSLPHFQLVVCQPMCLLPQRTPSEAVSS